MRRRLFMQATAAAVSGAGACSVAAPQNVSAPRRVEIVARRFVFSTVEIHAIAGETIVLLLSSPDLLHGFSVPELNLRADIPPGKRVELTLSALRVGRYAFLCDNFCGDGHDAMTGTIIVAALPSAGR